METKHDPALRRAALVRATIAPAMLATLLLGCDPMARPGGEPSDSGSNQQGTGDIFDTASSGNGGDGGDGGGNAGASQPNNCGGGPYVFTVSASDVDPWLQTGAIDPDGTTTLWLWKAEGGGLGAVAADFQIQADPGTIVTFQAVPPSLNIDHETVPQVFLAVAGCEEGPQLLGEITIYGAATTLWIRLVQRTTGSVGVDCCGNKPGWPIWCEWFVGAPAATPGSNTSRSAGRAR